MMRTDQIRAERKKSTVYYAATGKKVQGKTAQPRATSAK
jgi:hypothetical protein